MNDESAVLENTEESSFSTSNTLETENASPGIACSNQSEKENPCGADEDATGVFTDTDANSCFDCEDSDSKAQKSELEQLRSELKLLKEELALRDARALQEKRVSHEYEEFCNLYPDVPMSSLSQEIWQDVEKGTSLAAAYALAEKKKAVSLQNATESNTRNRARSAGAVNNAESIEFSPAEVRAMSSQEVRANLSKIMRSMQKWH